MKKAKINEEKVKEVLEKVRPALQADGGNVELVGLEDKVVKIKLQGACSGCPMSQLTLRNFIEEALKKEIPEIEEVREV